MVGLEGKRPSLSWSLLVPPLIHPLHFDGFAKGKGIVPGDQW